MRAEAEALAQEQQRLIKKAREVAGRNQLLADNYMADAANCALRIEVLMMKAREGSN